MTHTETATARRWIDAAEVARMIRKDLRRVFPGVKFTVRTSKYSMGASVDVGWTDGPIRSEVEKIIGGYAGARFDGMTDLQYGADSWYCDRHGSAMARTYGSGSDLDRIGDSRCCAKAELIHSGADYVHGQRRISPELMARCEAQVARETGLAYDPHHWVADRQEWMSTLALRVANTISA